MRDEFAEVADRKRFSSFFGLAFGLSQEDICLFSGKRDADDLSAGIDIS